MGARRMRLLGVSDALLAELPEEDQAAIQAAVGEMVWCEDDPDRPEYAVTFISADNSEHTIWMDHSWLDELTDDGLSVLAIEAATDDLERSGKFYCWWPEDTSWRCIDPIGQDEFQAVAASIIRTYFRKLKEIS
jgi:hypothetical protein